MSAVYKNPEVFIHTGMGRTGTTFLQHQVFPKLQAVYYHPRIKFRRALKVIKKGRHERYLISGEMEYKKLDRQMKQFSAHFPDARPIIILRRHDEWIASQHRRFVKSGYALKFEEFFSIENDSGYWEQEWLRFMGNIEILERYFKHKPLVMFYDDLKNQPVAFILKLSEYIGARLDVSAINLRPKHVSYNKKQLKAIYTVSKIISLRKRKPSRFKEINILLNLLRNVLRYAILFLAPIIPAVWLSKDIFLANEQQLMKIHEHFISDWKACLEYAEINNPVFDE